MGCGASTHKGYLKQHESADSTLPDNTARKDVSIRNSSELVEEQKRVSNVNSGTVRIAQIIQATSIEEHYEVLDVLGRGMSGCVRAAKNRTSGIQVALKQVNMKTLSRAAKVRLYNEVHIALLMDHPHIVKVFEVYETADALAICLEICEGGALLDYVQNMKSLKECQAARITKQMCLALSYMHSDATPGGQICHRDIKLENFMFMTRNYSEPHVKLIDFGLSKICEKGSQMTLFAGSLHYFSPELLAGDYDFRCDLWALGVTVYILLFGIPPFTVKTSAATYQRIREGRYRIWKDISPQARDFLARLLHKDPMQRTMAGDLARHEWLSMYEGKPQPDEPALSEDLVLALQKHAQSGVFRRAVLKLVSLNMPSKRLAELRAIFKAVDSGNHGVVTLQEFTKALEDSGISSSDIGDFKELFHSLDMNKTDTIAYSEFLAALIQAKFDQDEYRAVLQDVFRKFDRDNSGAISEANLREVLGAEYNGAKVEDLIAECDRKQNGEIDFNEFMSYLSACVAADAIDPVKDDGLAGSSTSQTPSDEAGDQDGGDTVQAPGEVKKPNLDAKKGAEGKRARQGDAFKVVSALVASAEDANPAPSA